MSVIGDEWVEMHLSTCSGGGVETWLDLRDVTQSDQFVWGERFLDRLYNVGTNRYFLSDHLIVNLSLADVYNASIDEYH